MRSSTVSHYSSLTESTNRMHTENIWGMVDLLQDAAVDVHEAQAEQRLVVVRGGAHLAVHRQQRRLLVVGRRAPGRATGLRFHLHNKLSNGMTSTADRQKRRLPIIGQRAPKGGNIGLLLHS